MKEYKVMNVKVSMNASKNAAKIQGLLVQMVSEGWKLIFVNGIMHYFERDKRSENDNSDYQSIIKISFF